MSTQEFSALEKRFIELCKASYRGDLDAVKELLKLRVLPSCQDPSNVARPTPLHNAALKGHIDVAEALLDMRKYTKLDVNAKDTYGWTPLHYAVSQKRTEMVKYLVRRGASVNARTERMVRTKLVWPLTRLASSSAPCAFVQVHGVAARSSPGEMVCKRHACVCNAKPLTFVLGS